MSELDCPIVLSARWGSKKYRGTGIGLAIALRFTSSFVISQESLRWTVRIWRGPQGHMHAHTWTRAHANAHTCTCAHVNARTYARTCTRTHANACTRTHANARTRTHANARIRTHALTHRHTLAHTHHNPYDNRSHRTKVATLFLICIVLGEYYCLL